MNKKHHLTYLKKPILVGFLLFIAIFCTPTFVWAINSTLLNVFEFYKNRTSRITYETPEDRQEVIKIGYKENYGVIKTPYAKGNEGYGFEYINAILRHTKQKYHPDFIQVDWSEGLKMLETGELDLLVGANYTTERNKTFIYLKEEFCHESLILVALNQNSRYLEVDNINNLQGKKICVQKNDALAHVLYTYLEKNNISATIFEVDFGSVRELENLDTYDYALTGTMQMEPNLSIAYSFHQTPVYIIANKNKIDLVENLNSATNTLLETDYLIKERLYLKYYDNVHIRNQNISKKELSTFAQSDPYIAGIVNLNSPVSFKDTSGNLAGIITDIFKFIEEILDVKIDVVEITPETQDGILEMVDFYLLPKDENSSLPLITSNPLLNLPYILVEKNIQMQNEVLGTLDYYGLNISDIDYFIRNQLIIEFESAPELIAAFNKGTVTNMFLTAANFASLRSEIEVKGYQVTNIDYNFAPALSFSLSFPQEKITIFNKILSHITAFDIAESVAHNVAKLNQKDEMYYLHKYRFVILSVILGLLLIIFLVTRHLKNQKIKEIQQLEDYDKLTDLFSYERFVKEVYTILENTPEYEYIILSADIDNFRYVNEIYGYNTGSDILCHIAYYIKNNMESPLPVAVHSGDNFLILFKNTGIEGQSLLQDHIDKLLKELEQYVGKNYNFSFSIGIYKIIDREFDVNFMIDCANIARSKSKAFFGTSIEYFTEEMKQLYNTKNEILSNVKSAFIKREFHLFYQPKFSINTMEIVGAEALIRWFQDDKVIPPDNFIPIIEGNGMIDQLDYYVVDAVCRFIRSHEKLDLPKISLNISGHTIINEEVVAKIIDITRQYGVHPSQLDMEITESALVDNFEQALTKINTLRDLGFTISMDDFGTGISSLNRLRNIPIDILKIDRGFIIDSLEDTKGAAIIKNIINLAKDIYVETVAEGIETTEQLEFLRKLSCDVGQGYYFSRPLPETDFIELLQKNRIEKII